MMETRSSSTRGGDKEDKDVPETLHTSTSDMKEKGHSTEGWLAPAASFMAAHFPPEYWNSVAPDFNPVGSMKRLQKVVEMVYLDDDDDVEVSLDDLIDLDRVSGRFEFSSETRKKASKVVEGKHPAESFKDDDCVIIPAPTPTPTAELTVTVTVKVEVEDNDSDVEMCMMEEEDNETIVVKEEDVTEKGSELPSHFLIDWRTIDPRLLQPVILLNRWEEKAESSPITTPSMTENRPASSTLSTTESRTSSPTPSMTQNRTQTTRYMFENSTPTPMGLIPIVPEGVSYHFSIFPLSSSKHPKIKHIQEENALLRARGGKPGHYSVCFTEIKP